LPTRYNLQVRPPFEFFDHTRSTPSFSTCAALAGAELRADASRLSGTSDKPIALRDRERMSWRREAFRQNTEGRVAEAMIARGELRNVSCKAKVERRTKTAKLEL
jgi:hypothetical protein